MTEKCSSPAPAPKSSVVAQRPTVLFVSLRHGCHASATKRTNPNPTSLQASSSRKLRFSQAFPAREARARRAFCHFVLCGYLSASVGIRRSVVLIFHVGDISGFAPVYPITISMRWCIRLVRLSEAVVHKSI